MAPLQTPETIEGRAAYYRSESERVRRLATETAPEAGRERFLEVAREYRLLADYLDPEAEAPEPPGG